MMVFETTAVASREFVGADLERGAVNGGGLSAYVMPIVMAAIMLAIGSAVLQTVGGLSIFNGSVPQAVTDGQSALGTFSSFLPIVVLFALIYFLFPSL